jgi:hypothetical protein
LEKASTRRGQGAIGQDRLDHFLFLPNGNSVADVVSYFSDRAIRRRLQGSAYWRTRLASDSFAQSILAVKGATIVMSRFRRTDAKIPKGLF